MRSLSINAHLKLSIVCVPLLLTQSHDMHVVRQEQEQRGSGAENDRVVAV